MIIILDNEEFSLRLKKAMQLKGIKQSELSRKTGIDKSLISNYLSGNYKAKQDKVHILAKALDVSESWLMGFDVTMEREWIPENIEIENCNLVKNNFEIAKIPLYGVIKAGVPMEAQQDVVDYIEIPTNWIKSGKKFYALRIVGNSMYPKYSENDIVIFENVNYYQEANNKDCVVMVNATECTFKKVLINEYGITLQPYNTTDYQSVMYSREQAEDLPIRIVGIAVRRITDIE